MPKIQYKVNLKATMEAMMPGEIIILTIDDGFTLEGLRTTASRLRPKIFSVNKVDGGAQITRKS